MLLFKFSGRYEVGGGFGQFFVCASSQKTDLKLQERHLILSIWGIKSYLLFHVNINVSSATNGYLYIYIWLHYLRRNSITVIKTLGDCCKMCAAWEKLASESTKKKQVLSKKKIRKLQELINYKNVNWQLVICKIKNDFSNTGYRNSDLDSLCWSSRIMLVTSFRRSELVGV